MANARQLERAPAGGLAPLQIEADVLIAGGGMAACWAGISAARTGAKVVLVDKGYVGTSGVTATAGPGHWWVSPEGDARKQAIEKRMGIAHGLADPNWMERIIDATWRVLPTLSKYYRFNINDKGDTVYNAVRGPEYLRALRRAAVDAGVTILDQSPVLELLLHDDGSVAGVNGVRRQEQRKPMTLLPFARKGITDVYEKPFEVKLFAEGTIRGTGGLRIIGEQCETTIPGLFAAGDTATRELVTGATSGGGVGLGGDPARAATAAPGRS
jgi:succinate dehydrogenase/fumarate reductase flavoprotein subunit